jgi:hypothetical protein
LLLHLPPRQLELREEEAEAAQEEVEVEEEEEVAEDLLPLLHLQPLQLLLPLYRMAHSKD